MLKYYDTTQLRKNFGDFGGNADISDFDARSAPDVSKIIETIESDEFEKEFRKVLPLVCDDFEIKKFELAGNRVLYAAPALAKRYILAARIAHARCLGKESLCLGSDDAGITLAAVTASRELGMRIYVTLSKRLAEDTGFVQLLRANQAEVDDKTCVTYFDHPYAFVEVPFTNEPEHYLIEVDANYGVWPKPALTSVFASLFGADILEKLERIPEAAILPIVTGTNAIGVIKALKSTGCKLATCEQTVAMECHMIDTGAYTISTRGAAENRPNTTICPELANMWHKCQVMRLGCDRLTSVDVSALTGTGLSDTTKRAAAIGFDEMDCRELLVLEV